MWIAMSGMLVCHLLSFNSLFGMRMGKMEGWGNGRMNADDMMGRESTGYESGR